MHEPEPESPPTRSRLQTTWRERLAQALRKIPIYECARRAREQLEGSTAGVRLISAADACAEVGRRFMEAARDAKHRLRTGCARGMPSGFDVLVHPCSSGCTMPARQLHGLVTHYGERYPTVRLKVRTMAEILGWSERTLRKAITELRDRELLQVSERVGRDRRRVANGYVARGGHLASGSSAADAGPPARQTGAPCTTDRGPCTSGRARTPNLNSEGLNEKPRTEDTSRQPAAERPLETHGTAAPSRSSKPGGGSSDFRQALDAELLARLQVAHAAHWHAIAAVLGSPRALEQPGLLRRACEGLLADGAEIENPPGYLVGILRRQKRQLRGMEDELRELEEQLAELTALADPSTRKVEKQIMQLRERIADFVHGGRVSKSPHGRQNPTGASPSNADPLADRRANAVSAHGETMSSMPVGEITPDDAASLIERLRSLAEAQGAGARAERHVGEVQQCA